MPGPPKSKLKHIFLISGLDIYFSSGCLEILPEFNRFKFYLLAFFVIDFAIY